MKDHTGISLGETDPLSRQGLWRTTLAGPGCTLAEAFANLERSPQVQRVLRHPRRDILSARVSLSPDEGRGYWELIRARNDLYVIILDFMYKDARFELVPGDGLVQFNFNLSGDLTYAVSRSEPLRFNRPSLHIWRQAEGIDMREWTAPNAHERMVAISVRPEFLLENFLPSNAAVPSHLQAFVAPPGAGIDFCQVPLTSQMIDIASRILDNRYSGVLALVHTEVLAVELLCAAVGTIWALSDRPSEAYSGRELLALQTARQLLMTQYVPAPTLRQIARTVGLGEKTLTRGFKAIYGETVFEFGLRCRMRSALTLLQERRWSVQRVSEAVGYAHASSFATAFRRHFGLRPGELRRAKPLPAISRFGGCRARIS